MTGTVTEERAATKNEQWREQIGEQERSGLSVKQFCKEQGFTEYSFYAWRKRLRGQGPVRFALVERGVVLQEPAREASDFGTAPAQFGVELLLPREAIERIR
jgi:hypothetical protein